MLWRIWWNGVLRKKCTFSISPLSVKGRYDLFLLSFLLTDKVTQPSRIGKASVLSRTSLLVCDNWLALRLQGNFSSIYLLHGTRSIEDLNKCWVIGSQNRSVKFGMIWKEKPSKFWLSHSTRDRQNVCPREPQGLPLQIPPHWGWYSCRCLCLLPVPSSPALLWTSPLSLQGNQRELETELRDACWLALGIGEPGISDGLYDPSFLSYPLLLNSINLKLKQIYLCFPEHPSDVFLIGASF